MSGKSKLVSRSGDAEITDDDSSLMSEQSSSSNSSKKDISAKQSEDDLSPFSDAETQQENLEYTEMQIEEPPSSFDSQYMIPHPFPKSRIEHPPMSENGKKKDKDEDKDKDENEDIVEDKSDLSPFSDTETQQESLEYTEMQIEEPPSFFDSQYTISHPFPKSRVENRKKKDKDEDENEDCTIVEDESEDGEKNGNEDIVEDESEDEVFHKKIQQKRAFVADRSAISPDEQPGPSSRSQRNRKPRKPRDPRGEDEKKPIFHWEGKRDEKMKKLSVWMKKTFKNDSSHEQPSSENGNFKPDSDTPVPVSGSSTEEIQKKVFKHITIALDEKTETTPIAQQKKHHELKIAGVNVQFPVKPYPSQIAVMNKLIQGCKKQEHCLLESPTGSGKTLALLCGVLAWQDHMKDEVRQQYAEAALRSEELFEREYGSQGKSTTTSNTPSTEAKNDEQSSSGINYENSAELSNGEVLPPSKKFCRSTSPYPACLAENQCADKTLNKKEEIATVVTDTTPKKVPKIYYGSRTHKQIEQVVRELKKTVYAYKQMTILSSREFTCLHDTNQSKTELCTTLLDPTTMSGCRYYNESNRSKINSPEALASHGVHGPWDIEDLVRIGREQSACPYFAARDLMIGADIIFCPYNYLIDPNIRDSMQLQLNGQIVILDEAHNVEEMSRDVGSLSFREDKIEEITKEAKSLSLVRSYDFETYNTIAVYLESLLDFIKFSPLKTTDKFNDTSSSSFWTGVQLWELFKMHSLGVGPAKSFERAAAAAIMDYNSAKEESMKNSNSNSSVRTQVICATTKRFLEDFTLALEIMASEKLSNDYRACIVESNFKEYVQHIANSRGAKQQRLRTLQMLCMNPAVVFSQLANAARTIVLASGTLSPIHSFQSELATVFPHKLDANHVVPKENVYIRGVGCGPTGVQLKANYTNVNSWNFQDELGRLVLNVCKAVPHGILCFFSSYSMMQKQIDRWKQGSIWKQLEEVKQVLQEPRGSSNLEPVMQQFKEIIHETSDRPQHGITGALLFAVFRGKVAEGIDFSDNEARCVMAVGIPYAIRKDPSVDMKFTYNDLNQPKGLLKGGEWYAVQAFRALNQALGRCVRHRNDWGAVLLIDQRFLERSSFNYLPKWVKTMWRDYPHYNLTQELTEFVARQVEREQKEKLDSAEPETSNT